MKIILCTRDLRYGTGTHIATLLKEFDKIDEIEKILVIGPQNLDGFSPKIHFEILKTQGRYFITKQPFFAIECRKRIEKALKLEEYDLIHTHYPLISKNFGIPLIATFHTLNYFSTIGYHTSDYKLKIANLFHRIYEIFDKNTIKHSSKVIFVSNNVLNAAKSRYKTNSQKFVFIPNFIDTSKFFPLDENRRISLRENYGLSQDKRYVTFVGRLEPLKGVLTLVNAIKELRQRYKDIELLVAGDGPIKEQISKFDFVRCLGRIPYQNMNEIYNISDYFVLPSLHENSPSTVLEAMSCSLPVIVTATGDTKEIVNDERMIVDEPSIKEKIGFLLELSEDKLEEIQKQNRKRIVNYYNSKKNVAKVLEMYKDCY